MQPSESLFLRIAGEVLGRSETGNRRECRRSRCECRSFRERSECRLKSQGAGSDALVLRRRPIRRRGAGNCAPFSGAEFEYQHVRQRVYAAQSDFGGFVGDGNPVSGNQRVSVEADGTGCDVYPDFVCGGDVEADGFVLLEQGLVNFGILVQGYRAVRTFGRGNADEPAFQLLRRGGGLHILGFDVVDVRLYPDLQKMDGFAERRIHLAVGNAGAGAHLLDFAGFDDAAAAHAVAVFQFAVEHDGNDFHVFVRMGTEAFGRGDDVVVNDAQVAETEVTRVVIGSERKGVAAVEPRGLGVAAVAGSANRKHFFLLDITVDMITGMRADMTAGQSVEGCRCAGRRGGCCPGDWASVSVKAGTIRRDWAGGAAAYIWRAEMFSR